MLAMPAFRGQHQADPAFAAWLKEGRPLSRLKSLRTILDLDRAEGHAPDIAPKPRATDRPCDTAPTTVGPTSPRPATAEPTTTEGDPGPIVVGHDQRPDGGRR